MPRRWLQPKGPTYTTASWEAWQLPLLILGRGRIGVDVDAALLGFNVKLRQRADAESVVRRFLLTFHVDTVFGNDFAVLRRGHGGVANVPAEGLKEGVDEGLADVGFLDAGGEKGRTIPGKVIAQRGDFVPALLERLTHDEP